jgi:uncharacterized membrane protein YphA (DoxX/SURF4 family)
VRRDVLPWVGLAIRLVAAAIWLVAGIAKIADLEHFHRQVDAYELLPQALEAPFAYTLPFVETGIGIYLAVGLLIRPAAILGSVLMALFIVAMAQAWARGLSLDCGCFGAAVQERVGFTSILRDAALGVPTIVLALWPARKLSLDTRLLGKPDRFTLRRTGPPDVFAAAA